MIKKKIIISIIFLLLFFSSERIFSQWNPNPSLNTPVCTAGHNQKSLSMTSDLNGGAIIAWEDYRKDTLHSNVFIQRIDKKGYVKWIADGIPLFVQDSAQKFIAMISDSSGGVIVCWQDKRGGYYNLFAQRIDSAGNLKWAVNGVAVAPKLKQQKAPSMTSDGNHGAIIVWEDTLGTTWKIYAQRLDGNGTALWTAGGIGVCNSTAKQYVPKLTSDGNGGAFVVWLDKRNTVDYDIYAQRINSSGALQWGTSGVFVCSIIGNQISPKVKSDNVGGAIVVWEDYRSSKLYSDVYAQRLNGSGVTQWTTNGVAICTSPFTQNYVGVTTVGVNGALIAWTDGRSDTVNTSIYAQRIDANGTIAWASNGIKICASTHAQKNSSLAADRMGGAFIAWDDSTMGDWDILSQRIDANGNNLWAVNGIPIGTATGDQKSINNMYDGYGGCIFGFTDGRNGIFNADIYAHHLDANGNPPGGIIEEANPIVSYFFPNPFIDQSTLEILNSNLQLETLQIKIYNSIGKEIYPVIFRTSQGFSVHGDNFSSGIYFYSVLQNHIPISKGKFIVQD